MKYFKVILLDLVVLLVSKNAVALLDYILICYSFFQSAVLQLTVLNDPETLSSILNWGEKLGLTPGTGGEHCTDRDNPILAACQQDFKACMAYLYHHGYRMKEFEEKDKAEEDDQVKQFLRFQAASNIHYLSLEFTQDQALYNKKEMPDLTAEEIQSLEKKDPIRKVFALIEYAQENTGDFQGSNELKSRYYCIVNKLEAFTGGILTQCKGMHEVTTILDHNPEDDDDDELDEADTNWQVALYRGYKDMVSHPNFQQYLWRKMTGDGSVNNHIPLEKFVDKMTMLRTTTK